MTTTVFLVRHGQTNSNTTGFFMGWSDEDLNEVGYAQAQALSSRLANLPISSIYTSPLRRAYNTATILAKPHQLELKVMNDLIEIQAGDWQGLHIDEIQQRWPGLWEQSRTDVSNVTMPNGESFGQVTERAVRAFDTIIEANHDGNIAMVSHEVVIKVIVAHVLGATNSIYRRFEIKNTSLSIIRIVDGKARLITLNATSHLEA
jgi:broad specificity phosphatase PhoE